MRDSNVTKLPEPGQDIGGRVRQLQAEAKALAAGHVEMLNISLARTMKLASEVAEGGDAYPPGIRDIARRLVEDSEAKITTINAILGRTR